MMRMQALIKLPTRLMERTGRLWVPGPYPGAPILEALASQTQVLTEDKWQDERRFKVTTGL